MKRIFTLLLLCATIGFASCDKNEPETPKDPEVVAVTGVKLDKNTATINFGETLTLVATVEPENATNKAVRWRVSDPLRFEITQDGKLIPSKDGLVTVFVNTEDGNKEAKCVVDVKQQSSSITSITLDKKELTLSVGQTERLIPTLLPETAFNKVMTWTSSDESIATVEGVPAEDIKNPGHAVVTAIKEGECKIVGTSKWTPTKSVTCIVKVTAAVE